jgi:nucleotidyltransferase substrate binding protein (TIGR01987 family)
MKPNVVEYEKALSQLAAALREPKTDLVRDATIQRFEFCVELAWKTARRALGTASTAPRVVIREMADQKLIADPEPWFDFLDGRNLSSHTYREDIAEKVYGIAQHFLPQGLALLGALKQL